MDERVKKGEWTAEVKKYELIFAPVLGVNVGATEAHICTVVVLLYVLLLYRASVVPSR